MASGAWIAVLLGGGAAAALVLYERKKAATPPPPTDDCAPLKAVDATAYDACKAASGLWGVLDGLSDALGFGEMFDPNSYWKPFDDTNKTLNGDVEIPRHDGILSLGWESPHGGKRDDVGKGQVPFLAGTVVKFKNGCTPFEGSPGWSKCAKGTTSMLDGNGQLDKYSTVYTGDPKADQRFLARIEYLLTGKIRHYRAADGRETWEGDPTTGLVDTINAVGKTALADTRKLYPNADLSTAQVGVYKGQYFVCEGGKVPHFAPLDTRPDAPYPTPPATIACLDYSGPTNIVGGGAGGNPTSSALYDACHGGPNPPPGYSWVTDHWERTRRGAKDVPAPCGVTATFNGPHELLLDGDHP